MSGEPRSLNGSHLDIPNKTSVSNYSRETSMDDIELTHGVADDSVSSPLADNDKQQMFKKTYSAQENTAASLEEVYSPNIPIILMRCLLDLDCP